MERKTVKMIKRPKYCWSRTRSRTFLKFIIQRLHRDEDGTIRDFKKPRRQRQRKPTSLENISSRYLYYFVIVAICSTCTMWPSYPVTEQRGTAFKLRQRMKNLPSCDHVLHKTLNLVISRCCLA